MNDICTDYDTMSWEIMIPAPIVLLPICVIRDKTNLLVISLIRFAVYMGLLKIVYDNGYRETFISYFLVIMAIVNILYIIMVILKKPVISPRKTVNRK